MSATALKQPPSSIVTGDSAHETDPAHKKVIVEKFSCDSEYWRKVYDETSETGKTFVASEMVDRRHAVLAFIDGYAEDRQLRVLDVGCGTGLTMREILHRGHSVAGVDITEAMVHQARASVSQFPRRQARCILSDVEHVPFGDGSFDVAVCIGVLQYLQTDEKAVREISRVVRDGGVAIITVPNLFKISNLLDPYYYLVRAAQFIVRNSPWWKRRQTVGLSPDDIESNRTFANRRYYYGQLSKLFERNNLTQVDIAGIAFGPLTFWRKPFLPLSVSISISRFFQRMTLNRQLGFLNVFANRWVICLQKRRATA